MAAERGEVIATITTAHVRLLSISQRYVHAYLKVNSRDVLRPFSEISIALQPLDEGDLKSLKTALSTPSIPLQGSNRSAAGHSCARRVSH